MGMSEKKVRAAIEYNRTRGYSLETWASVQSRLGIKADGDPGAQTADAVFAYQGQCGLFEDGKVGEDTLAHILELPQVEVKVSETPPPVHLAAKGTRDREGGRAFRLKEDLPADITGRDRHIALVDFLDVEASPRYRLKPQKATYCNVYAYDFCTSMGAYLPRVWWFDSAIKRRRFDVVYGETVRELSANSLYHWLMEWGGRYGWDVEHVTPKLSRSVVQRAQEFVDAAPNHFAVICAKKPTGRGHITVVLPTMPSLGWEPALDHKGQFEAPIQSQAGTFNRKAFAKPWFASSSYSDVAVATMIL